MKVFEFLVVGVILTAMLFVGVVALILEVMK